VIDIVKEEHVRPLIGFQDMFEKKTLSDKISGMDPRHFFPVGGSIHA